MEVKCRGPLSRSGTQQPPIRAFVDNLTVSTSVAGCRWLLQGREQLITWARVNSWDMAASAACQLFQKRGSLEHIHLLCHQQQQAALPKVPSPLFKQVMQLEQNVPCEEQMEEAHQRKKYSDLADPLLPLNVSGVHQNYQLHSSLAQPDSGNEEPQDT